MTKLFGKKVNEGAATEVDQKIIKHLAEIISQHAMSIEIDKKTVTIKADDKFLLSFTGKILVESTKRVEDCKRCNSDARKKELAELQESREHESVVQQREKEIEKDATELADWRNAKPELEEAAKKLIKSIKDMNSN